MWSTYEHLGLRFGLRPHKCLHPVHNMRRMVLFFCDPECNASHSRGLIGNSCKNMIYSDRLGPQDKDFPLSCYFCFFSFRLQQQRSEDGLQETRALRQLPRAGLAGSKQPQYASDEIVCTCCPTTSKCFYMFQLAPHRMW